MNIFHALILSAIEGITEFLPISSTGHLLLASKLLQINQTAFVKSFEIIIQLGAILAVVYLYRKTLTTNFEILKRIGVSFIPTALVGFTFYPFIKGYLLENSLITLIALLLGGVALIVFEFCYSAKTNPTDKLENISYKEALVIGLFQAVSVIPGVSRAAATIIGGVFTGLKRSSAVEYSFLLAIPTMFAATGLDLLKSGFTFTLHEYWLLLIGLVGSFSTALIVITYFLRYIKTNSFIEFGIYRIILAIMFLVFIL